MSPDPIASTNEHEHELSDVDNDDEYLEVPSCVESLVNSAGQLRQLALQADHYYSKLFMCHEQARLSGRINHDPLDLSLRTEAPSYLDGDGGKLANVVPTLEELQGSSKGRATLNKLNSTLKLLPLLNETSLFIERCSAAIESTIRRVTYYLGKSEQKLRSAANEDTFQLTEEVRIDMLFIALMDLMFALVKFDKILTNQVSVKQNLHLFLSTCKTVQDSRNGSDLPDRDKLSKLIEYVTSISVILYGSNSSSGKRTGLFDLSVRHVEHLNLILSKDKTSQGFKRLGQLWEGFITFFAELLNADSAQGIDASKIKKGTVAATALIDAVLVPTIYMRNLTNRLFGLSCLLALHNSLFKKTDKRVITAFNQAIQRTEPNNIICLVEPDCYILFDNFLREHVPPSLIENRSLNQLAAENEFQLSLNLASEFERMLIKTTPWLINLESEALDLAHGRLENWPRKQVVLLDRGLKLANEISWLIWNKDITHRHHQGSLTKTDQVALFRLVALLKAIDSAFEQHELFVSTCLIKIEHLARSKWRQVLSRMQKRQISTKHHERKLHLDSLLLLTALSSRPEVIRSDRGRDTQSICLAMLLSSLDQDELRDLNFSLDLLRLDFYERLDKATNCSSLYLHMPEFSNYYNYTFEMFPGAINEIHYFQRGVDDIAGLFDVSHRPIWSSVDVDWITKRAKEFLEEIACELMEQFKSDFVCRVCQEFEVELRLQTHRELYNEEHNNPFRRQLYNFKQMIRQDAQSIRFKLFGQTVDLNNHIEQHLDRVCYNFKAIAPHDWFAYDSMLNLARHKYNLNFVDAQLPMQAFDPGLDLLDITRNLPLFASRYSYDFTNQLFVEKCSNRSSNASSIGMGSMVSSYAASLSSSQSLNVLQAKHVAHSIQTHGYGVLDSTINCTYQALKRLVNLFSRQISDDKLRATLQKELQQFVVDSRTQTQPKMSLEKANKIAKQFRLTAANLNDSNTSQRQLGIDLDSIRQTVTQIGNLLAFIRLIKSGALNCVSRSVDYLPELDDLANWRLSRCAESEFAQFNLQPQLLEAAKNLDQCLSDFQENFSAKTNYLKIIVGLFTSLLSSSTSDQSAPRQQEGETNMNNQKEGEAAGPSEETKQNSSGPAGGDGREHLKLFFLLVPPLIINYIDHLINCKERVTSRSSVARFGALVSDDGFPLGVAFLLTVLGQTNEHNKLDWLSSTCAKLREDIGGIVARSKDSACEESLRQTSSMTMRRLNRLLAEYVGLENTLNCALLLFSSAAYDQ